MFKINILWGIVGIIVVLFLAYLLSNDRKNINLRTISGALFIQLIFAFITLETTTGQTVLLWVSEALNKVIDFANEGISFLFGSLVEGEGMIFAFEVLTIIIFFSALISILYYFGIMQWIIDVIGGGLSKFLQTTKIESLSTAANIFLGQTEAPLVVKPYLSDISNSELFAIMVGGFGSVSGTVLVGYSLLGIPLEYLLAASFMSAPSALLLSKIVHPLPKDQLKRIISGKDDATIQKDEENQPVNVIDAAAQGASTGLNMAIQIAGILLAFVSLIALINGIVGGLGGLVGLEALTLERILGTLISPLAFLIGVPWEEALAVGELVAQKLVTNEFIAFASLGELANAGQISAKTLMLLSFSLAGFANFGAIASQIGGLGALAPNRRGDLAKLGFKAMLVGQLVSFLNAAIAGIFF